jgi:predicted nucleic acid-binding protein
MRVVVNDASSLIDLRKGQLLPAVVQLPYRLVIPYPVRESEILDFSPQEWRLLDDAGVETLDLPGSCVARAYWIKGAHGRLSANDCFCLVTAEQFTDSVLLTGDRTLRTVAERHHLEVHGVLWIVEELHRCSLATHSLLRFALTTWRDDPSVFLPDGEITRCLSRLK